jgi:hypothetical protein
LVIRRSSIAIAVVVLIACGFLLWYRHALNKRAQLILCAAFERSEKQAPTLSDFQKHFGQELRVGECRASDCADRVAVSNRVLAVLHLAPYTKMESHFWVRNGVVLMNMLNCTTTVNHRNTVVSHVQIDFCGDCQSFSIHPWIRPRHWIQTESSKLAAQSEMLSLQVPSGCWWSRTGPRSPTAKWLECHV